HARHPRDPERRRRRGPHRGRARARARVARELHPPHPRGPRGAPLRRARPRLGDRSVAALGFDALCALRDATGETAQLCVRAQNKCVIIEQAASRHPVKVLGEIGFRVPMYSCAPGKAMLAALPAPELAAFFKTVKLKRFTPTTLSTKETLSAALAES